MRKDNKKLRRMAAGSLAAVMLLGSVSAAGFTDTDGHWAKSYIDSLSAKRMIQGYEDGSFRPEGQVTYLETLTFVSRLYSLEGVPTDTIVKKWQPVIEDAMKGSATWSYTNLALCLEAGVLTQAELQELTAKGQINGAASREDLAVCLTRAMQLAPVAATLRTYSLTFPDAAKISKDAMASVYLLNKIGVIEGMDDGTFQPQGKVTRAQVATMLSRAINYMEANGLEAVFPNYTTYTYEGGTVMACTQEKNGLKLTIQLPGGENRTISVPSSALLIQDGAKTTGQNIMAGAFARVRYTAADKKTVQSVWLLSSPKTAEGTVQQVDENYLVIKDSAGVSRTYLLDRLTQVWAGGKVGDRSLIDSEAGYTYADCTTDGTGRILSLHLQGGGYKEEGILTQTSDGQLLLTGVSGALSRYSLPASASIQVNGVSGALTEDLVGRWVTLRLSYENDQVTSVSVDGKTQYVRGILESTASYQGSQTIRITDVSTGGSVGYRLVANCPVTYEGKETTLSNLNKGSLLTLKMDGSEVAQIQGASGSWTVTGSMAQLTFGDNILLEVQPKNGPSQLFSLKTKNLPAIYRDGEKSSIDRLSSADTLTVAVVGGKVSRIDAKTQSVTVTGTVDRVSFESQGNLLYLRAADGTVQSYVLSAGVQVVQGSTNIQLSDVVGGQVTMTVVNGLVTRVELNDSAAAAGELTGKVLYVNAGDRVILLESDNGQGRVSVSVPTSAKVMRVTGTAVSLNSLEAGASLQIFGSYKGEQFEATMVLVK